MSGQRLCLLLSQISISVDRDAPAARLSRGGGFLFLFYSFQPAAARRFAAILGQQFAAHPGQPLRVLGPTPMNIAMISGKYRYKLTLKCRNDAGFRTLMHAALDAYAAEKLPAKAGIALDFNSDGD